MTDEKIRQQEKIAIKLCLITIVVSIIVIIYCWYIYLSLEGPSEEVEYITIRLEHFEEVPDQTLETLEEEFSADVKDLDCESLDLTPYYNASEEDLWLLSQVVSLESRGESYECQLGVASVVLNRMTSESKTLSKVVYAKNQFSVVPLIGSREAAESAKKAASQIVSEGPSLPTCVTYFRAGRYHNWSKFVVPYCQFDNTYFSHYTKLCDKEGGCQYEQEG